MPCSTPQERRKVEEQYVAGLRKLLLFKVPNAGSELGYVVVAPPSSGAELSLPD